MRKVKLLSNSSMEVTTQEMTECSLEEKENFIDKDDSQMCNMQQIS